MYWIWGALGAFILSVNAFIFAMWNESGRGWRYRAREACQFLAALITGAIFAQAWTDSAQPFFARWMRVDSIAVALTIGWLSNYLWPKLLKKLGERVDKL